MLFAKVRGEVHSVPPGRVVVLPHGSAFELFCRNEPYSGVFALSEKPIPLVPKEIKIELGKTGLLQIARQIEMKIGEGDGLSQSNLFGWLHVMFTESLRQLFFQSHREEADKQRWVSQIESLVLGNLHSDKKINELLKQVPLGHRQLSQIFRKIKTTTIKQFQLTQKIEEAKKILLTPGISVSEVAIELGFPSSQHLATQFKKAVGVSPKAFRTQLLK